MIDAENLTKRFGDFTAVDDLTFHVDKGEIFGFLGPNGAGKTTTLRILSCLISPSSGEARVGDFDVRKPADALKIRRTIGLIPDDVGLYDELSASQNLEFYGKLYDATKAHRKESIERLLKMLGLWEQRGLSVGTFSKGMRQKIAIARALVHDPEILLLDEPTANLDPESAKTVRDFILELKGEGKTVLLNTHNLGEAQTVCDRIGILNRKLLTVGVPGRLEHSLWRSRTVIQLDEVTDAIVEAVKRHASGKVAVEGNTLTVDVASTEQENPDLVAAIVSVGGRVQLVTRTVPTLEDVYLKVVRESR